MCGSFFAAGVSLGGGLFRPRRFFLACLGFFQAEDGIRDRSPSRGLGDVYKRQFLWRAFNFFEAFFVLISS